MQALYQSAVYKYKLSIVNASQLDRVWLDYNLQFSLCKLVNKPTLSEDKPKQRSTVSAQRALVLCDSCIDYNFFTWLKIQLQQKTNGFAICDRYMATCFKIVKTNTEYFWVFTAKYQILARSLSWSFTIFFTNFIMVIQEEEDLF